MSGRHYQRLAQSSSVDETCSGQFPFRACNFGSSGLSRGGAQRYTQLIGCESALRRLNHFTWNFWVLTLDVLARGIHLLSNLSGSFRAFSLVFSSFRTGFRSSKEYSRYRSNINYVRSKQVNNPESFCSVQSSRRGAKHRVARARAAQRSSHRELQGHTNRYGLQTLNLRYHFISFYDNVCQRLDSVHVLHILL